VSQAVLLHPGARLAFDGELVEVIELEATRVMLRDSKQRWKTLSLTEFVARAQSLRPEGESAEAIGPQLAALTEANRRQRGA
jgi:hypothetical protein